MQQIHVFIGFAIVSGFFVLFAWGGISFLIRRHPTQWFWRLVAVLQVSLVLQLLAGLVLLALGRRQALLHYFYGVVFPLIVLVVAHVLGRGMDDEGDAWKIFTVAAFFVFGLTLRALTTGLDLV